VEQEVEVGIMLSHVANYTLIAAWGKGKLSHWQSFDLPVFRQQVIYGFA
jgi:hypothetical protein